MSPRPQVPLMEQYKTSGAGSNMKSPTTVTNSIRGRPKSTSHPRSAYASQLKQPGAGASSSTTSLYHESKLTPPQQRRRPLGEMGKFRDATTGSSATAPGNTKEGADVEFPRKMEPKIVGGLLNLNHNVLSCAGHTKEVSKEFTQQYAPIAKQSLGLCANQTAVVASDLAVTASEVYRQECRSDHRGRDSELHQGEGNNGEGNKYRNRSLSRNIRFDKKGKSYAFSDNNSLASSSMSDIERRDSYNDHNRTGTPGSSSRRRRSGTPSRSPQHSSRHMNASTPHKNDELDVSPPAVSRTSFVDEFQPQMEDNGSLMEARMELFQLGESGKSSTPRTEARLTRALQDLKHQDSVIFGWKRQLETTQKHLDDTFAQLEKAKKESQEKQITATEIRARAVQESKKVQELYEQELEQRRTLEESVSKLQREVSSLKVSLRNARNSNGASPPSEARGLSPEASNPGQIISLKAEIVELRSQLAEAHAASIDDHSTLHSSSGEVEELKRMLKIAEVELDELRKGKQDAENAKKEFQESEKMLKDKIGKVESEAKETQKKLSSSLSAAFKEENQVRSELAKVQANVQRLERERSRKRVHSAADVERLTKQLARAKEETTKIIEEKESEERAAREESEKLKGELKDLKQKLFDASKEFASKATMSLDERMKMAAELKNVRGEVTELKSKLELKTEEVTSHARKISGLEAKSKDVADRITSSRQITELQEEIKSLKENEVSLRAEITEYKSLLQQERDEATKSKSLHEAKASDESAEHEKLRNQVEELQLSAQKWLEQEDLSANLRKEVILLEKKVEFLQRKTSAQEENDARMKAAEQSFKNEIAILNAKLAEAETKCTEERFRAEEERRISKENATQYARELDEFRQENEKYTEDKLQLRQELEDLRKQMASQVGSGRSSNSSAAKETAEVPSKVTQLRSELALARARLAAAREQTAILSPTPMGMVPPTTTTTEVVPPTATVKHEDDISEHNPEPSDMSSSGSVGSCWAPPGIVALTDTENSPADVLSSDEEDNFFLKIDLGAEVPTSSDQDAESLDPTTSHDAESQDPTSNHDAESQDPTGKHDAESQDQASDHDAESQDPNIAPEASKVSFWEMALMKEESKMEQSDVAPRDALEKGGSTPSPRSAFSFGEKSLVDDDEGETFPESPLEVAGTYGAHSGLQLAERERIVPDVDELRRQLQESSRRLEKANSRLSGLVDLPELKTANGFHGEPFRGINRDTFLILDEEQKVGGMMDEVVTSETDGFEVQRVRYADV